MDSRQQRVKGYRIWRSLDQPAAFFGIKGRFMTLFAIIAGAAAVFTLVIGSDNLADIRRWRDYRRILKEYGVAVFPRTGFDLEEIKSDLLSEDGSYRITILKAEMVDISSTTIREALASGQDMSAWLM